MYLPYLKKKDRFLAFREKARKERLEIEHWTQFQILQSELLEIAPAGVKINLGDIVALGSDGEVSEPFKEKLQKCIEALIPWRTGPFQMFNQEIDSEWKSNMRWDRLKLFLPPLKDQIIADIGCGNGYFIFRMLKEDPKIIFGFDPQSRCNLQFELINNLLKEKRILMEPIGIENMDVFSNYFNFVLCMGVIYHRRDPHTCLTKVRESMKPGGTFIIESLVIDSAEAVSFSPPDRYMKMRNVWFVPSAECMCSWLEKTGFKNVEILLTYDVGMNEQRRTRLSPDESLVDFVDPKDSTLTVEGYKIPKRAIVRGIA